jgi:hypothetical protein
LNKDKINNEGMDGRIYGWIETQGRCMKIGVSNLKVACGKNLKDYETAITDEDGFFEFSELSYEDTGTRYIIWIPLGQKVIFPGLKNVELNDNNPEEDVYFFVLLWWSLISNKVIKNQLFSFGSFAGFQSI